MPVMRINVPRRSWNRVQLLADLHAVEMWPELWAPRADKSEVQDGYTTVELTGPADKLFQVFRKTDGSVKFVDVLPYAERDQEPGVPV